MRALHSSKPILAVLLVSLAALAGCFGGGKGSSDVVDPTVEPTFGADTGAIQGQVLGEDDLPVVGAQVGLQQDRAQSAIADAQGIFVLSDLAPGDYNLEVQALGFETKVQRVTVAAGEVNEVQIELVARAVLGTAYHVTAGPIAGKFFCGFGTLAVAGPCMGVGFGGPLQAVQDTYDSASGGERNIFLFPDTFNASKQNAGDQFTTVVIEVTWVPTSTAAQTFQVAAEKYQPDGRDPFADDFRTYGLSEGVSPVRLVLEPGKTNPGGDEVLTPETEGFQLGVFPPFTETPNAYTEQRFEVWVTVFYNEPAPEGFTMLEDA